MFPAVVLAGAAAQEREPRQAEERALAAAQPRSREGETSILRRTVPLKRFSVPTGTLALRRLSRGCLMAATS